MDTSSENLDESMLDVIERAEAFLSAHSTLLHRGESQRERSISNMFDSSTEDGNGSSFATANGSSSSVDVSTSRLNVDLDTHRHDDEATSGAAGNIAPRDQEPTADNTSTASGSSSSQAGQIEVLSDSDDTVSYELNLPEAESVVQHDGNIDNDDCVVVASFQVPTVDLCSSPAERLAIDLDVSPRTRRNQRRQAAAAMPVVDLITLDDTVAAESQTPHALSTSPPPPKRSNVINQSDLDSSQAPSSVSVMCPICFDSIFKKQASSTICGHLFCKACISQEIELRKKCPICKRALSRRQIHPIYFN